MNKILLLLSLFTNIIYAQTSKVQQDLNNFEPGELIVKLKDNVDTKVYYSNSGKANSDFNIGQLLGIEDKISSSKVLFHQKSIEASIVNKRKMKAVYAAKSATNPNNGYTPKEPLTMKNVFVLKTNNQQETILQLIQQIKDNPNVEYAQPNYIYGIDDFEVGEIITAEKASKLSSIGNLNPLTPNDPLYSSQTNITSTNIDDVWGDYTTGDGSQVIAILDTGADYTHPDLEANTWINTEELNGVEGYDDDGNGYVDDIRGWDFINTDNAPLDDNMHGTHVAGIAGAVGDNGVGIAGAAWNVKLMHIKVFQSTGQGNSINIAAGVEYAYMNGATIINMSFGSYAESSTLKLALENAYSTSVLVASAGNDEICIGPGKCPDNKDSAPSFPGSYSFVLGVEDGVNEYDNYDQDGPIATGFPLELLNYEIKSPGSSIMSTIPGGGYATLTGTSMSAPLVAGGLALYNEQKPDDSNELLFGSLINSSSSNIDFLAAIEVEPTPQLAILSATTRDTINSQNGNTINEPGETIELLPLIKNYWGPTEDVRVGIAFAELEDTTKATIVQHEIQIGSISAYASLQDLEETLKITISEGVANNVDIKFVLTAWSGPDQEYMSGSTEIVINVKNSIILSGVISSDYTFLSSNEYLIADNLAFNDSAVVTVEPGTTIKISDDKQINFLDDASLICNGTKDDRISFLAENNAWSGFSLQNDGSKSISFTNIKNFTRGSFGISFYKNTVMSDVLFWDIQAAHLIYGNLNNSSFDRINLYESTYSHTIAKSEYVNSWTNSNLINISCLYPLYPSGKDGITITSNLDTLSGLNILNNYKLFNADAAYNSFGTSAPIQAYLGSGNTEIIGASILDLLSSSNFSNLIDISQVSEAPNELAHGLVWKILVNDKDAQDEYDLMDPVGVGTHEFKVYFNRAMDTSVNPRISYGVTIPYTQKIISETGTWSEDGKIYTVTHEVNIGAADGINRIRVQDAQDLDYFVIPVEDRRFNMLVQSAGSASAGWYATAGLGKIALTWEAPDANEIDDALGYNMYRYQVDSDGVESDPVKLNETLIIEDSDESTTGVYYTDFNVTEGQTYFYKYNILRTSFETTDYSSVVSTAPLTSTLGDSNGDFAVDVLDLVHDVDYILGNNPEPFIFVAGDVNADNTINVLDIVGTVDIILNGDGGDTGSGSLDPNFYPSQAIGYADFSWEGNDLYVESMHNIGGIQLAFDADFEYVLHELSGIERLDYTQDGSKVLMLYSFNNTSIASTKTKLLTRIDNTKDIDINLAVAGTTTGAKLTPRFKDSELEGIESPFQSSNLEFLSMYPNPSSGEVTMTYYLPEPMDGVVAKVYDMLGRLVHIELLENKEGASESQMQLNTLQKGNYIVLISADKDGGTKHIANHMLIIK